MASFIKIDEGVPTTFQHCSGIFRTDSGTYYALVTTSEGGNATILRSSTDGGQTWGNDDEIAGFKLVNPALAMSGTSGALFAVSFDATATNDMRVRYSSDWSVAVTAIDSNLANTDTHAIFDTAGNLYVLGVFSDGSVKWGSDRDGSGASEWNLVEDVESRTGIGTTWADLFLDSSGSMHALWYVPLDADRSNRSTIWHSVRTDLSSSGSWSAKVAIDTTDLDMIDRRANLVELSNGNLAIVYMREETDGGDEYLYYVEYDGSWGTPELIEVSSENFTPETSVPLLTMSRDRSLDVLALGRFRADPEDDELLLLERSGGAWSLELLDTLADPTPTTVALGGNTSQPSSGHPTSGYYAVMILERDASDDRDTWFIDGDPQFGEELALTEPPLELARVLTLERPPEFEPVAIQQVTGRLIEKPDKLEPLAADEQQAEVYRKVDKALEDIYEYLRIVPEEQRKDLVALADALPGDARNRFEFVATGDSQKEVSINHGLGYAPRNFEVVEMGDYGQVVFSRDRLADDEMIYLKTSAVPGTRIVVRVW